MFAGPSADVAKHAAYVRELMAYALGRRAWLCSMKRFKKFIALGPYGHRIYIIL